MNIASDHIFDSLINEYDIEDEDMVVSLYSQCESVMKHQHETLLNEAIFRLALGDGN
jgi:hypothetical protein